MHPALDALRRGDLEALGRLYAPAAMLEVSVPGERVRRPATEELAARFRPGVEAGGWSAREWPPGAAATLTRGEWRQRHYLHYDGDRVSAHWVYAAGVEASDGAAPVRPPIEGEASPVGGGNSGAALWRVRRPDGSAVVAKGVGPDSDWIARALGGGTRSVDLYRAGAFDRLPAALDPGVVDVVDDGPLQWLVMRDVGGSLLGDEQRLTRAQSRAVLEASAEMHEVFWGEEMPFLADCGARLTIAGPATWERELAGHDIVPKQAPVAWDAFFSHVGGDVAEAVRALLADPEPLVTQLVRGGRTLIHGDLRDDNLGFEADRIVLLDWDLATAGTPADEFCWYLLHDAWRIDATRDEIVADWRAAEGARVDDRAESLMALAGLVMYGWILGHSAVVHPDPAETDWARDELGWWVPRAREALALL